MLPAWRILAPLGLLVQGIRGWEDAAQYTTTCITVFDTTTVQVTHYVDVTISNTKTDVIVVYVTEYTTTTLHYTVSVTETDSATVTTTETDSATITNTETDSATLTNTETDSATITNTETDSVTITNTETDSVTITNTATTTVFSTTFDPCPKSCSISVETVNLFFWPTDRPYSYPSTYVDTNLDYTFTSPSVYILIPTAQGINTLGQPAGPSITSWMLPLNLYEVSTIAANITRQLTLSDLGTDCPQTADPTAIATMVDSRCDPVLAAPRQVSSWAYPCNACGRFGLFDPPYAIPTVTGPLVVPTITPPAVTVTVVSIPPPTSSPLTTAVPTSLSSITQPTTTVVATASATRHGPVGSLGMWSALIAMIALY